MKYVQTKSVHDTIILSELSNTAFTVPGAEMEGKVVIRAADEPC